MCIRVASIAVLVVALFLPSQSKLIHTIAKEVPRPFLDKVSEDAKKEFWNVAKDKTLSVKQLREKQLKWAEKYGIKDQLQHFFEDFEAKAKVMDGEMTKFLAALPEMYNKFMLIADDSKTMNDILEERRKLAGKNKEELKTILDILVKFIPKN
ncbi:hypothetical protein ANCCEY_15696 [Ancylostoma ceylanicum]|uniref:SXP/RAL-2 family protein Ani s 5-like cation-binding domain-containing protein n=2 Tax=Ancylostoma ceylanicum TaxID=53326 RepID=A0A0D6L6V0_9BILA|nr:hypothetical protein ANCCEY_15696 [Ancylostoma ceylanicum]EYC06992.1 hypothetical protein Y032_0072g638 [Ancylostoma ceylanicum]